MVPLSQNMTDWCQMSNANWFTALSWASGGAARDRARPRQTQTRYIVLWQWLQELLCLVWLKWQLIALKPPLKSGKKSRTNLKWGNPDCHCRGSKFCRETLETKVRITSLWQVEGNYKGLWGSNAPKREKGILEKAKQERVAQRRGGSKLLDCDMNLWRCRAES